jgi:hypothetical protein
MREDEKGRERETEREETGSNREREERGGERDKGNEEQG